MAPSWSPLYHAAIPDATRAITSAAGSPRSRAMASARRPSLVPSASWPLFSNAVDRPSRTSASTRDGPRSCRASQTAVKWPTALGRSADIVAAQPSQNCAAHHPSLPGSARPATSDSSRYWPGSRAPSHHHQHSATASRSAMAGSWSTAQASTWRMVGSSASSRRAAAASPALVCSPAEASSATRSAYPASAADTVSCSPASARSLAP